MYDDTNFSLVFTIPNPTVSVTFNVNMNVSRSLMMAFRWSYLIFYFPGEGYLIDEDGDGVWTKTIELEKTLLFHTNSVVLHGHA